MGTRDEPYITSSGMPTEKGSNNPYPSLTADQLSGIQNNMSSPDHTPTQTPGSTIYDKPTVIELDRVDPVHYDGFVLKGALKVPNVEIERQQTRVGQFQQSVSTTVRTYSSFLKNIILFALLALYTAYFAWALIYSIDGATALIVLTCITVAGIIYSFISNHYGEKIYTTCLSPIGGFLERHWRWARW